MASTFVGKGSVKGINVSSAFAGGTGAAFIQYVKPTGNDVSTQRPFGYMNNGLGEPLGAYVCEGLLLMDMTLQIQADTKAHALTAIGEPAGLARVTLSGFDEPSTGAWNHARWIVVPNTWRASFSQENLVEIRCQIACSTDASVDISAPIT